MKPPKILRGCQMMVKEEFQLFQTLIYPTQDSSENDRIYQFYYIEKNKYARSLCNKMSKFLNETIRRLHQTLYDGEIVDFIFYKFSFTLPTILMKNLQTLQKLVYRLFAKTNKILEETLEKLEWMQNAIAKKRFCHIYFPSSLPLVLCAC